MGFEALGIGCHVWVLDDVVAGESGKDAGTAEFVVGADGKEDVVDTAALEEKLLWIVEGFLRGVPSGGEHEVLALHESAHAVLLAGVFSGASIVLNQSALGEGGREDLIDVFLKNPRHTKPVGRSLQDDEIGPLMVTDGFLDVVASIELVDPNVVTCRFELPLNRRGIVPVEFAIRETFVALMGV